MPGTATLGDLVFKIVGDTIEFNKAIDASEAKAKAFTATMDKVGKGLSIGVTVPLLAMAAAAVKSSANMEMLQASFTTMLGSADKATALMTELKKMASVTPFETTDLANASKTLLQFGITGEKVIPTLQMLGDISQGNNAKFNSLALVFGQMSSAGRLMGQDLLQMINAGFNPLKVISEKTGESMAKLKDRMSKGAISADEVTKAFKDATSQGGLFYKGMDTASKTLEGLLSTLKDDVMTAARAFSDAFLPQIKETVKWFSSLAQKVSGLDNNQKQLVLTLLAIAASIGPVLLGLSKTIQVIGVLSTAIKALSASSMLTPLGLITGALAVLTVGIIAANRAYYEAEHPMEVYQTRLDDLIKKTEAMKTKVLEQNKSAKELLDTAEKNNKSGKLTKEQGDKLLLMYPSLAGKVDVYTSSIKDLNIAIAEELAIERAKTLTPLLNEFIKTQAAIKKTAGEYTSAKIKYDEKDAEIEERVKKRGTERTRAEEMELDKYKYGAGVMIKGLETTTKAYDEAKSKGALALAALSKEANDLGLEFDKNTGKFTLLNKLVDEGNDKGKEAKALAEERRKKLQDIVDSEKTTVQKLEEEIASAKALTNLTKEDAKLRDEAVAILETQLAEQKLIVQAAETERDMTDENTDAKKKELEVKKQLLDYAQGIVDSSKDDLDTLNEKISDLEYAVNLTEEEKKIRDKALDILKLQRDEMVLQDSVHKTLTDREKIRSITLQAEADLLRTENELIEKQNESIQMGTDILTGSVSALTEINTGIPILDKGLNSFSKTMSLGLDGMMKFISGNYAGAILDLVNIIVELFNAIGRDLDALDEKADRLKDKLKEQSEDEFELEQQKWKNHVKEVEMANEIASINKQILDEKLKLLDVETDAKLKAINDAEKAELAAAGFIDKTELQTLEEKLAETTDIEERAELEKEIEKQKILDKYEAQRKEAEELAAKEKRKILHDQAVFEREITIANIKLAQAELQAKATAASGVSASGQIINSPLQQLLSLYDQLIASISAVPLPALASGGIVMPTPGGTQAIIGEGNQPEVVFPLDQLDRLLSRYGNNTVSDNGMMNLTINMDSKNLYSGIFNATKNKTVLISAKAVV